MMIKMFCFFNVFLNKINNSVRCRDGFAQVFLLVGMLLVAISLPIATKLVQQNQENRSKAASSTTSSTYTTCSNGYMKCSGLNVQTCRNGSWTTTKTCNSNQTCEESSDTYADCKTTTAAPPTTTTYYYYNGTSCVGASYTAMSACGSAHGTCYSSRSACEAAHTPTCTSCGNCATLTICNDKPGCTWSYSGNYCETVSTGSCGTTQNTCTSGTFSDIADTTLLYMWNCGNKTCSVAKSPTPRPCINGYMMCSGQNIQLCQDGSWVIRTVCNDTQKCEESTDTYAACKSVSKTYYYYAANGACSPTSLYTSVVDCNSAKGVCFSSLSSCTSAYSCESLGGTCRSVCSADESLNSNGYYECQPAKCCVTNVTPGGSGRNCIIGSIECISNVLYQCGLGDNSGYTMRDVGKKCIGDGDKIVYWDDVPKDWVADGIAWSNLDPKNGKVMINPGMDLTKYQAELMKLVEEAGPRTRAGVVAAASYLAELFPYKVPYYPKGGTKNDKYQITTAGFQLIEDGIYTADWGTTIKKYQDSNKAGLCCTAFVEWALRTAGYDAGLVGSTENTSIGSNKTLKKGTNDQQKTAILDTIKPGDLVYKREDGKIKHVAMIVDIDYASGTVKIAQSSSFKGVNIEYLDIFTLKPKEGTNSKNSFDFYTSIDGYFEETEDKN